MNNELPPGTCYVPEIHGEIIQKKPRLLMWCEAESCWMPATPEILWNDITTDCSEYHEHGQEWTHRFKRVDMTDAEFAAIPEA